MRAFTAFVVVLSFASGALAAPVPAKPVPVTTKKPAIVKDRCALRIDGMQTYLTKLEADLKLIPAQKPLFDAWKKKRMDDMHSLRCPPLPVMTAPMPARQQNQITMMTETANALRGELPLTTALYKALTPVQRKAFDNPKRQ